MNLLGFVLLVTAGIIFLAVGIDVSNQIWREKQAERDSQEDAIAVLYAAIAKRFASRMQAPDNVVPLEVVARPQKPSSVGGRHRLTAA
jgi:hypothetical protein